MEERIVLSDFPKIHCPFIRQTFAVDKEQWKRHGRALGLREPNAYLVVDRINPGYEWVFEDPETIAVEKLNGMNVKILTRGGRLLAVQNRMNVIDPLQVVKGQTQIIEGIFQAIGKGWVHEDGEQVGELLGPKVQANPYRLLVHEWFPFGRAIETLTYRSFGEHARTFANWSEWFREHLTSRLFTKRASKLGLDGESVMAEGVVFYNLKRRSQGQVHMAKLRRDMYDWYFHDKVAILDYEPKGRDVLEDQEKFD